MGIITALTVQKRRKDRVNLFLDGQFAFGLPLFVASQLKLGQALSAEEIVELQQADGLEKAKQTAVRFISFRPRSIYEVRQNLRRKEIDEPVIEQVLEHLQEIGLLDDVTFARYWVEQRDSFKPRSAMAIQQELQQKGVDRTIIEDALSELDELSAARRAAAKKAQQWAHLPEDKFRKKLGQHLQRRGFHYGIIREISEDIWQEISLDNQIEK